MRQFVLACIVGILLTAQALAGTPHCYLHGIMRSKTGAKSDISDMLRLQFDANTKESCLKLINAYCRHNVRDAGYSPRDLSAFFKPDREKKLKTTFKFSEDCQVLED